MQKVWILLTIFFLTSSCITYQSKVGQARNFLADGESTKAKEILAQMASEEGKDQVLYMLDYGLALHQAGDIKESNETLIAVDRLAEVKDYVSLSRQAGSLFLSEALIAYKSERFENILINAYLALNFTLLGNYESALVECRRLEEKLYKLKLEGEDTQKSFYARYLSALIWQAERNWDSAYIDFKKAYDIDPSVPYIGRDLIRAAWQARRYSALKRWQKKYPKVKLAKIKKTVKDHGELVFIYQQGWIPRKRPRPENFRFPYLVPVPSPYTKAYLKVNGVKQKPTQKLYEVGQEAVRTLDADYGYLVAKKILGVVAKEVAADQIRQKNELLGAIAKIAMHAADQADLRQWSTLPDTFQISKVFLKPGKHRVSVWAQGRGADKEVWSGDIEVKKGKKTFITKRTF